MEAAARHLRLHLYHSAEFKARSSPPKATPSPLDAGPPHRRRPGLASQELTTATASISIMKSGPARRVTPTVVLVGVATPR